MTLVVICLFIIILIKIVDIRNVSKYNCNRKLWKEAIGVGIMDKVTIHHSNAYDFLAGMYRLNNNEKLIEIKFELGLDDKVKFNDDILKWVETSRGKLTSQIRDWLDLFFNYESFFGICLVRYIADKDLKSADELLDYIRGLPCKDILGRFLGTGYGNTVGSEQIEEMLANNKAAVSYIEKNISLPSKQKWELLQFFLDPDSMKEKLLQLFEWYYGNIFKMDIKSAEDAVIKQEKELEKKLRMYGEEYLKLLVETEYTKNKVAKPIVIALSYYYEIANLCTFGHDGAADLYMFGYRYPALIAEGKHALISSVSIFKALADETRLNIIKLLCQRPWYGNELAQELKLSNSTISYHMSMLLLNGFVEDVREDNRSYFSLDIEKVKKILSNALDNMLK